MARLPSFALRLASPPLEFAPPPQPASAGTRTVQEFQKGGRQLAQGHTQPAPRGGGGGEQAVRHGQGPARSSLAWVKPTGGHY